MGMHNYKELRIWQRSMSLVEEIYKHTIHFPVDERFGLISQVKRSAVSIPSNISEGAGRATNKQFRYFLEVAMGSCNELQTQVELAKRLKYIDSIVADKLLDEAHQVYKMILSFYNSLADD
jgi:four helix bundle protein